MPVLSRFRLALIMMGVTVSVVSHAMAQDSMDSEPQNNLIRMTNAAEQNLQETLVNQPEAWVSSWLAGAPIISAAILNSQTRGGSDELELALTLPLISPSLHQLNSEWQTAEKQLQGLLLNYRRWYASGQVRRLIWEIAKHRQQQNLVTEQLVIYGNVLQRLQQQAELNEADSYHLYLYQQARTELAVIELEHQQQLMLALEQLKQLTGMTELPKELVESSSVMQKPRLNLQQHPQLALLEVQEQLLHLQYQQASSYHSPWQLTTRVKRVSSPEFDDNQIGVQLDVPLGLGGNQLNQADKTELQLSQQQWLSDYRQMRIEIQQAYQQALSELNTLEAKFQLLKQNQLNREQAKDALLNLIRRQEINLDIAQQRLDQIFAQERQLSLLKIQIHEATANLYQAAGVSL